ncbi:trypsin-like peptidase domain-containing protein [Candidatus Uhrbacteria bacterium]|nr:trypsin-like peptidase domain-containing protein [Candidatus Uhrbacteria bacterium]
MRNHRLSVWTALTALSMIATPSYAAELPFEVRQASVIVQCGDKQGSGVVINGSDGYVLTNAHVLLNETTNQPDPCTLGFVSDQTYTPNSFYRAESVKYVYDEANNRDFAILKIGRRIKGSPLSTFPYLMTDEFSELGDPLTLITYPRETAGSQFVSTGTIDILDQGTIRTDAFIGHGSSGGPGVDARNHLIGIARGVVYAVGASNEATDKPINYQLVDIRNVITWLDTSGTNAADSFITHADPARYQAWQAYVVPTDLSCQLLAKSLLSSTVYCLKSDHTRAVFPNDATFISWFPDFNAVTTLSVQDLATYQLTSNVTLKTGSLVKINTDPKVYLVADSLGTLRWIQSETRVRELFGDGWAGFVKDIPVEFFPNYHIGDPLP